MFDLSEAICAIHQPLVVTVEPQSPAILKIALAADRSAKTWTAHCDDRRAHHFIPLGLASDRGRGVVAGSHSACEDAPWVCDQCHAFHDLCDVLAHVERKA